MKAYKLILTAVILFGTVLYAQPEFVPQRPGDIKDQLGLSKSQAAKVEKIFKDTKQKTDKLREKEFEVVKNLRDSTKSILDNSRKAILKILNKDQAEKFGKMTAMLNENGMMPPPPPGRDQNFKPGMGENFPPPPNMMRPNRPMSPVNNFDSGPDGITEPPCLDDDLIQELDYLDFLLPPVDVLPSDSIDN